MVISGFLSESLIDHPGNISFVVYTAPCNFRCPYCHNPSLVTEANSSVTSGEIISEIKQRAGFIDSVTVTGGEPTINSGIMDFLREVKKTGLKVKLDTNGYKPEVLAQIITEKLADYIAMDIKASPCNYKMGSGIDANVDNIKQSAQMIIDSGIEHEFRTTAVPGIIEEKDISDIGAMIKGASLFVLQQFHNADTLKKFMINIPPYPDWMLDNFAGVMRGYVNDVRIYNIPGKVS